MFKYFLFIILCFSLATLFSQNPWQTTNSPLVDRYDDVYFLNKDTGWAVGSTSGGGVIIRTNNGGNSWYIQKSLNNYCRSIEFRDKNVGFFGALNSGGGNTFMKTANGGYSWNDISSVITGLNGGICGICVVNIDTIYAVGVYSSPGYVIKSTDGGNIWSYTSIGQSKGLVDVQFVSGNMGYMCGRSDVASEGGVILKTIDGGLNWTKVFTTNNAGDYVWKLQNLDGKHWYASIQKSGNNMKQYAYSIDGGYSWLTKNIASNNGYLQAIGFMDTLKGWSGSGRLFQTNDGGDNWIKIDSGGSYNRFFKTDNNVAYLSGTSIFRYNPNAVGIKKNNLTQKESFYVNVFPNPTKSNFTIKLKLEKKTMFNIMIIDGLGKNIFWEQVGQKNAGEYEFKISEKFEPGIYYVSVITNEGLISKKVIIQ